MFRSEIKIYTRITGGNTYFLEKKNLLKIFSIVVDDLHRNENFFRTK